MTILLDDVAGTQVPIDVRVDAQIVSFSYRGFHLARFLPTGLRLLLTSMRGHLAGERLTLLADGTQLTLLIETLFISAALSEEDHRRLLAAL